MSQSARGFQRAERLECTQTKPDTLNGCDDAVAVVGMAVRLSGGVNSTEEFWDALIRGKDGLCEVPGSRYNIDGFYDAHLPQSVKTRKGYYLEHDPMQFDAAFFGIKAVEAEKMDPQQRQLLEVTWECLESAGLSASTETSVGCYVGVFGNDWLNLDARDSQSVDRFHISGAGPFALSNRLSHCFDWQGPSMTLQTACSSSLVGLHEACQALKSRSCRSAVVAGVNLIVSPTMTMAMSDTKVLSPDGACKTFDEAADGYGRGEGISVVYIKRLSDAIKDNDHIRGIIRATSTNHNGKTMIPTSVCQPAQERLITQTYKLANIQDITKTALFECHGTGTQAGDTVEVSAIARATANNKTSPDPIILSSTKPNFGHTEGASGLVSVIKSILCLENDSIPPSIFFETPNPKIPFGEANLVVPRDAMPFPKCKEKRVSVNCFGVGGSNAHAIIDAASTRSYGQHGGSPAQEPQTTHLFVVSAKDEDALEIRISTLLDYTLLKFPASYRDIAYTLACRRQHFAHRAFAVAHSSRTLALSDFHQLSTRSVSPIWVFTGQGSQWAGMARQLCETSAEFRRDMEELNNALNELADGPNWSITEELCKLTEEGSRVHETELAQPLCTALTIGVVNQLKRWGLQPSAVIGHSSGEMVAAYASGAITAVSAIKIAYYRGIVAKSQEGRGGMTAVALGWKKVLEYLQEFDGVSIACRNGPGSTVISGQTEELGLVAGRIKQDFPEVFCRKLRVSVPYHSMQMKEPATEFEKLIAPHLQFNNSMIPMYSTSALEKLVDPSKLHAEYWSNGITSAVEFEAGIKTIIDDIKDSHPVFLEIGPHSALSGPLRQIFQDSQETRPELQPLYIPTLTRNDMDHRAQLLSAVGRLHCLGVPMDMQSITGVGNPLSDIGSYPWKRQLKAQESRIVRDWRLRAVSHHELLGSRVTAMPDAEPAWRNILRLGDVLWLGDHILCGNTVFPAAGYIAMVGAASMQLGGTEQGYSIKNLRLKSFLTLKTGHSTEILTTFKKDGYNDITESEWYTFAISSHDGKDWTVHCTGKVRSGRDCGTPQDVGTAFDKPEAYHRHVSSSRWYKLIRKFGYEYGQSFRNLENTSVDPVNTAAVGNIVDHDGLKLRTKYVLHPTKIDQCLQLMGIAAVKGLVHRIADVQIPLSIGQLHVMGGTGPMKAWVNGSDDGNRSLRWEAVMMGNNTAPLLSIKNLRSVTIDQGRKSASTMPLFASLRWKPLLDLHMSTEGLLQNDIQGSKLPNTCCLESFLSLLGHSKPRMRVLHVYASSDNAAQKAIQSLTTHGGVQLFSTYTYSDTTNVALDAARLQFNHATNVVFKIFDPTGDIKKQGMEENTFDFIMVSSVNQPQSQTSLEVLHKLLRPSGWLVVRSAAASVEVASDCDENTVFDDKLPDDDKWQHVNSHAEDLSALIRASGFKMVAFAPEDQALSSQNSSEGPAYICQALNKLPEPTRQVVLLTSSMPGNWANDVAVSMTSKGYHVSWSTLNNPPLPGCRVICLLDVDGPTFKDLSQKSFDQIKDYLTTTRAKDTLWVTRPAQISCDEPSYGLVHGLLRTLRREMSIPVSILELSSLNSDTIQSVINVYEWTQKASESGQLDKDYEFAASCDGVHVGRYHWENLPSALCSMRHSTTEIVGKLCLPDNFLDDSRWELSTLQQELGADDVEVDISYISLNFRDVMIAMGLLGTASQFGLEASGKIRRVGSNVKDLGPGDLVGILRSGIYQSRILTHRHTCWRITKKLSLEAAAAMMVPYLTAMYALLHAANLKKNQTVLVHSACGGVGLAAVRICQAIGAKVYATVGSDEKAQYLSDQCSLSRDEIFNSRDDSFVNKIMLATGRRGVDVVLNSLAGKLLHASWQCVASFGKMIELGKVDFATNGNLSMTPFAKNRAFIGVDLLDIGHERPELLKCLLDELLEWIEEKNLNVDTPLTIFEAAKTSEALRHMKQGQHIGKLLLKMPTEFSELPESLSSPEVSFSPSSTYMLIGGLGGLGRTVANWIVEHGASDIVFVGRTAGHSLEDKQFVEELAAQKCSTVCIPGSVSEPGTMKRAVAACRYPLRGILQMSAVLRDRAFTNMTHKDWEHCLQAKVQGTLNIHKAIQGQDSLDFFVLFGSLAAVCGNSGQANYAAANSFLESFAQFRQRKGLACSVLNLGPVEDVGMVSRDDRLLQAIRSTSIRLLSEKEVLQGLQVAIVKSRCDSTSPAEMSSDCIVNVGLSIPKTVSGASDHNQETTDARFAIYANMQESTNEKRKPQVVDSKFRSLITRIEENPLVLNDPNTELLVCRELGRLITGYLGDGNKMSDEDFAGIAIDSLMAIEIKDWVRGNMNMDIGMDQTSRSKTVGELARYTVERLQVTHGLRQDD